MMDALTMGLAMASPRAEDAALAGIMAFGCLFWILILLFAMAFPIFCFWRIFTKAGFNGAMALIWLVPLIGPLIVICMLAFSTWPSERKG